MLAPHWATIVIWQRTVPLLLEQHDGELIGMQALLQQAFRQDAIRREWKQHEARLVRVASLDYAAVFRSTHSAKQQQTLKHEFRQSIQISG